MVYWSHKNQTRTVKNAIKMSHKNQTNKKLP